MVAFGSMRLPLLLLLLNVTFGSAHHWFNWQYEVGCESDTFIAPADEKGVADFLKKEFPKQSHIKVVGNGHGFGNLTTCTNKGSTNKTSHIVSLTNLKKLEINKDMTVTVGAGWDVYDLVNELKEHNLSFNYLGAMRVQNIVGAISTGTHGTGQNITNMATQVVSLRVADARGEIRTIDAHKNAEEMKAFRVNLGALGLITEVTLKVQPTHFLKKTTKVLNATTDYTKLYTELADLYKKHDRMTVWGPHFNWDAKAEDWVIEPTFYASWWEPTNYTGVRNCTLNYCANGCGDCIKDYICYDETSDAVSCPPQGICSSQFYAEIEHFFPMEHFVDAAVNYTKYQQAQTPKMKGFENEKMIFQFRALGGDDSYMSPANTYNLGSENSGVFAVLEIDWMQKVNHWDTLYNNQKFAYDFQDEFGSVYNARSHWNKMSPNDPKHTLAVFPKLPEFLKIQERQDPNCQFANDFLVSQLGFERCRSALNL
ncbi:unnamed protein product [Aspergillus oryzae var. brunneus]|uniref:FAD linked oxidase domain-containing protein n=2 Tax=Aspergillus oryzae TaxID=5062 RepID=A0A1S9DQJ3_ASPOZ|nr:FAD linked oxidase domain-containing protein [Aspergillus oryzae]GMG28525.1 unnamed protein product [Aspergillus oryzae]GMG45668.1 unnamed protein product [Aspergillus oryzae var. brunneus]